MYVQPYSPLQTHRSIDVRIMVSMNLSAKRKRTCAHIRTRTSTSTHRLWFVLILTIERMGAKWRTNQNTITTKRSNYTTKIFIEINWILRLCWMRTAYAVYLHIMCSFICLQIDDEMGHNVLRTVCVCVLKTRACTHITHSCVHPMANVYEIGKYWQNKNNSRCISVTVPFRLVVSRRWWWCSSFALLTNHVYSHSPTIYSSRKIEKVKAENIQFYF